MCVHIFVGGKKLVLESSQKQSKYWLWQHNVETVIPP